MSFIHDIFKICIKPPVKKKILLLKMVITYYFEHSGKCPWWLNCLIFAKFYIYKRAANTNKHGTHTEGWGSESMRHFSWPQAWRGGAQGYLKGHAHLLSQCTLSAWPLYNYGARKRELRLIEHTQRPLSSHATHRNLYYWLSNFEKCFLLRKGFKPVVHMRFWAQTSAPKQRCKNENL